MKQTIRKREYKCKCGAVKASWVWDSDLQTHDFECKECGELIKFNNLIQDKSVQTTAIRTPTKNR